MMNLVVMCIFVVCFCFFFFNFNFAWKWQIWLHVLLCYVCQVNVFSAIFLLRGNGKFGRRVHQFVLFFLQFKFCLEMAILFVICMFCCVCFVKWLFFLQFCCREEMATLVVLLFNLPVLLCHQPGLVETPKARRGWRIGWRKFDMGNSVVYVFAGG